jgi:hypothetical protein
MACAEPSRADMESAWQIAVALVPLPAPSGIVGRARAGRAAPAGPTGAARPGWRATQSGAPGRTSRDALVRLDNDPEVGICVKCAHFLGRRVRDYQATVLRQRLRGAAESIRREGMARGWHEYPVTGPAFRLISRHLPW